MKKIFSKVSTALALATVGAANVFAQGLTADAPESIKTQTGNNADFKSLLLTIINSFLTFLGVLAVLMIIFGGILYITAGGDPQKADKGKKIIMYAVIGIVIILLSWALVSTVLGVALSGGGGQ
jgi:cytochrome bd-type quinol oxidase subunit 2